MIDEQKDYGMENCNDCGHVRKLWDGKCTSDFHMIIGDEDES
jgi:hypothetical protein